MGGGRWWRESEWKRGSVVGRRVEKEASGDGERERLRVGVL